MEPVDRNKNLEELEGEVWPDSSFGSYVVQESQRLRKTPLDELSIENLRLLIGQQIGLEFLVPIALEHLYVNPFVSGDFYEGDLLVAVLGLPETFWMEHPEWNNELVGIGSEVASIHETIETELLPRFKKLQSRSEQL
jgi:hypothetical protein